MRWIFFIVIVFSGCSVGRTVQTDLYFGQHKLDGTVVTDKEWSSFTEKYISKVFKEGSSIVRSEGNWYDTASHQLIVEPSWLVISINKMTPKLSRQIDSIGYWYKKLHQQQSVLRVDRKAKLHFL